MENWVEKPAEPLLLYLAWQAPDHLGERHRWAVGILSLHGAGIALRYLKPGSEFEALNGGRSYDKLVALGFQGYPGFAPRREHFDESAGVAEALMRRLPPKSRPDFADYKRQFRIPADLELSTFALLGQTEAKLPSDGFSVVDPLNVDLQVCDLMLEVAGYRYYASDCQVSVGQAVELHREPENPHDPNAVIISAQGQRLGYINRLQAPTFHRWLRERSLSAVIERLNGTVEKPRLFIFVRVRPSHDRVAA